MSELENVKNWVITNGLSAQEKPDLDLSSIVTLTGQQIRQLNKEDLQDLILKIVAYSVYLKSLKGTLLAQLQNAERKFKAKLNPIARTQRYFNKDERDSGALDANPHLKNEQAEVEVIRMKYYKIREIPDAIDKYVDILKMIYRSKID